MPGNQACTVYVGNLDERVSDRVLYEILIQAGRLVDLHMPRDRETNRPKGFAFAEYETVDIANYAVRLFSGLVTLYNRMLKFAISGQDKPSPKDKPLQNLSPPKVPTFNTPPQLRSHIEQLSSNGSSQNSLLTPCRFSAYPPNSTQDPSLGVAQSNGYKTDFSSGNYDYSRRVFGATFDSIGHPNSSRPLYSSKNPITYPSY